jgi:nucleotide-binding universal stress UspA family protein
VKLRDRTTVFRRILHPSDFSPASVPAFRKAVEMARAGRARLLIVHVLPPVAQVPDVYIATRMYEGLLRAQRAQGQKELDRLVAKARRAGVRASSLLLDFGIEHERIVRIARSTGSQLIVMGTHGRTGLAKMVLGSVAERVVTTARCPVLTVRSGDDDGQTGA